MNKEKLSTEDLLDALNCVTWYNCLAETVFSWKDLPSINESGWLSPPENYGDKEPGDEDNVPQLQVLWMIAVRLFGDYGTSPRYGWIEDVDGFKKWVLDITETWRGSDEYTGPDEYRIKW